MRRIFLFYFLAVFLLYPASTFAQSQKLSPKAQAFKNNLVSFIREEGFSPTISNNGTTVNFKYEGENYWIDLSGSMPVQLTIHIAGFGNKDANKLAILLACNEVNRDKYYVKSYVDDFGDEGNTQIAIEMPCHTAEEFRYVFNDCIRALATAKKDVQNAYDKNSKELDKSNEPFTVTECSVGNVDINGKVISDFGSVLYSYNSRYLKPKLTISCEKPGNYTIFCKLFTPNGSLSTGDSSPSGYSTSTSLYISSGTSTYFLTGWGSNNAGNWKSGNYRYEFYCNGVKLGYYDFSIK